MPAGTVTGTPSICRLTVAADVRAGVPWSITLLEYIASGAPVVAGAKPAIVAFAGPTASRVTDGAGDRESRPRRLRTGRATPTLGTMRTRLMLTVLAALTAPLTLARKPHPSPFRMTNEAVVVIEGTAAADGTVTVTRRWFAAPGETVPATILVPALAKASKVPFAFGPGTEETISPDTVLLFLIRAADGAWEPLLRIDGDNARGIVWFAGDTVWMYAQVINPGQYELTRAVQPTRPDTPLTPTDVRTQVERGLVARARWSATMAIANAAERAAALAAWIGPESPDGEFWGERVWADLTPALAAVGAPATPHLARIVATHADPEAVATACRSLARLGRDATDAVPSLIGRLRDRRGAAPVEMIRALAPTCDERAIPVLLDLLDAPEAWLVQEVAIALKNAGATGFVERIAQRIPRESQQAESTEWLATMLDAVHDVDAALAERLVRERFLGDARLRTERAWLRALRP